MTLPLEIPPGNYSLEKIKKNRKLTLTGTSVRLGNGGNITVVVLSGTYH